MYQAGRNDPCPCGSGKKFKKCHGASGPKKFKATILSTKTHSLFNRVNSLVKEFSQVSVPTMSLKERITKNGDSKKINVEIEKAKFNQEHSVESNSEENKEEKFTM